MKAGIFNDSGERIDTGYHPGARNDVLVVLGHGVTGNKDRPLLVAVAKGLAEKGWPCLRFSFAGNGDSEGRFEEATITKEVGDLKSVFAAIPQEKRIAYIGHSMGAAVGVKYASESIDLQALVSLAGMIHTNEFAEREFGEVRAGEGCMWDEPSCPLSVKYMSDMKQIGSLSEEASAVQVPWLLIHGTEDDVVPIKDSRDALAKEGSEKQLLEIAGAGHSFGDESYAEVVGAIDGFLKKSFGN